MPNPDTQPSDATLRAFAQDPVIEGFWRAYWDQYLAHGGDPDRAEEVAETFRNHHLPEMLNSPDEIIGMLVEGRLERMKYERAVHAVAEIGLVERIETAWGEGLALLDAIVMDAFETARNGSGKDAVQEIAPPPPPGTRPDTGRS